LTPRKGKLETPRVCAKNEEIDQSISDSGLEVAKTKKWVIYKEMSDSRISCTRNERGEVLKRYCG